MGATVMENQKPLDDPKFDKNDIASVANARFFRKSGMRMLLLLGIVIVGLSMVYNYTQVMPLYVYYACLAVAGVSFVYLYSRKQAEIRMALWHKIDEQLKKKDEPKA